ncbi:MAG: TIGR03960 family B12-binding radical SAM protein, partial [Dehalococcoidia bacterium]|nr:TIGR03960 family B12-binding radical SAM protein [Dehalococcoidia bacterium]
LGMGLLYHLVNQRDGWLAERVYTPWPDMEQAMREAGVPLYALESKRPIRDFDLWCFSLGYEQTYTNVLTMLDLAGLPVRAADRGDDGPIVLAGGPATVNPEPMSPFIDLFLIGEAEDSFPQLVAVYEQWRADGGRQKREFLRRALAVPGVYVPSFYRVVYRDDGAVSSVSPTEPGASAKVRRAIVRVLPPLPDKPIVPFIETVHDRVSIEVMRGCTRGCRFCQPGMATRPVRERSTEEILATADTLLRNTGYDEISLLSLSTSDHSTIDEVAQAMGARYARQGITISLSSLRVDSFSVALVEAVTAGKKSGLTFAPEAGTQRLRDVINKPISDDDLFRSVEHAFKRGWTGVKLYFMIGLPTETDDDIDGIVRLARHALSIGRRYAGGRASIRLTVSTFVPKPHTPFQWAAQNTAEQIAPKVERLRRGLRAPGIRLSWHDAGESQHEAALSRGDRRLADVIETAWRRGQRFDAWGEFFSIATWERAANEHGLSLAWYANRRRPIGEVFPWSHIDVGVSEAFLRLEYRRAL